MQNTDIAILNDIITQDMKSNVALVNQVSNYIISSGGKRIRPRLTICCGRIAGFSEGTLLHKMAAMIEYIHTATLLHDDIVDESSMRRGHKTANAIFGNAAAVLVGDFIYTRAFQMMIDSNSMRILKIMADTTNKISEGEVMQLLNIGRTDISETEYINVIYAKTAALFEAGALIGAIVAGADNDKENALAKYALHLGTAFQIQDDILDYTGDSNIMGKNIGDDLREGKITLPLIYVLKNGTTNEIDSIKQIIHDSNYTIDNMNFIIKIIKESNAILYCKKILHTQINEAKQQLDLFSNSICKTTLFEILHSTTNRLS